MSEAKPLNNDIIKTVMTDALVWRGTFYDIDTLLTPGIYGGSAELATGTFPNYGNISQWKYGALEVFQGRSPRIVQRLTSDVADVAVRVWRNNVWSPWKIIAS